MGTLQRLPRIVGQQRCSELTYTARTFSGDEAVSYGLALEAYASEQEMMQTVMRTASMIATKSPLTVRLGSTLHNPFSIFDN
jgi:enoyl-CoA hydratase